MYNSKIQYSTAVKSPWKLLYTIFILYIEIPVYQTFLWSPSDSIYSGSTVCSCNDSQHQLQNAMFFFLLASTHLSTKQQQYVKDNCFRYCICNDHLTLSLMSRLLACAPGWFRCACKPCSVIVHGFCSVHENMQNITASTFLWASGRAVAQADKDEGYDRDYRKTGPLSAHAVYMYAEQNAALGTTASHRINMWLSRDRWLDAQCSTEYRQLTFCILSCFDRQLSVRNRTINPDVLLHASKSCYPFRKISSKCMPNVNNGPNGPFH